MIFYFSKSYNNQNINNLYEPLSSIFKKFMKTEFKIFLFEKSKLYLVNFNNNYLFFTRLKGYTLVIIKYSINLL